MSATERRWLAWATVVLSGLALLPYLLADLFPPAGLRFIGTFWTAYDLAQYLSAMREGAGSAGWLVHDHLSPEPHAPALIYPFYVGLGKLAALVSLPDLAALRFAEVVARVVLVAVVYWFAAGFLRDVPARRAAVVATFVCSGLGGLVASAAAGATFVELNSFILLFATPHLMLGLALALAAVRLAAGAEHTRPTVAAGAQAACLLALGLVNPFAVPTTLVVLGLWYGARLARRRLSRGDLACLLGAGLGAAPILAYYALSFNADAFWGATYGRQNGLPTPPPLELLAALGPLAGLGIWGLRRARAAYDPRVEVLVVWVVAATLCAYLPLPFQRRFLFGVQPVLATLAGPASAALFGLLASARSTDRASNPAIRPRFAAALVGLWLLGSGALSQYTALVATTLLATPRTFPEHFQPAELWDLQAWLAPRLAPDETILAEAWDANVVAGGIDGRVFLGHGVATLAPEQKRLALTEFFDPATSVDARSALVRRYAVRYVIESPRSEAIGGYSPDATAFVPAFSSGEYTVYRLRDPGAVATPLAGPGNP